MTTHTVTVNYDDPQWQTIDGSRYAYVCNVKPSDYPVSGKGTKSIQYLLLEFDHDLPDDEVLAKMAELNCRQPDRPEAETIIRGFTSTELRAHPVIGLIGPAVDRRGSLDRAYVYGSGRGVVLGWGWTADRWGQRCRFAAIKNDFSTNESVNTPREITKRIMGRVAEWQECWVYQGAKRDGYGLMRVNGKHQSVHRILYESMVAPIPSGFTIDHLCRNHSCVNPAHLQPVTGKENTLRGDGPTAKNHKKTHCIRGHRLFGKNLYHSKTGKRICRQCNRERMHK